MKKSFLSSKIHKATVTDSQLDYENRFNMFIHDAQLMKQAEHVHSGVMTQPALVPGAHYVFYLGQLGWPISGLWSFLSRATSGNPDGPAQENLFFS